MAVTDSSAAIILKVYGHLFANTDTRVAEMMEPTFATARSAE